MSRREDIKSLGYYLVAKVVFYLFADEFEAMVWRRAWENGELCSVNAFGARCEKLLCFVKRAYCTVRCVLLLRKNVRWFGENVEKIRCQVSSCCLFTSVVFTSHNYGLTSRSRSKLYNYQQYQGIEIRHVSTSQQ